MKQRLAVLLLGLVPALVCAQDFPSKLVRIVVAFPAGSTGDVIARVIGPKLAEGLGQTVIVENRGGAGGNIGAQVVAKAPSDGHTLLATSSAIAINVSLHKDPGFAIGDFIPVIHAGATPNLIFVHPSVPANNLQELFALAKTRRLSYASAGTGTGTQRLRIVGSSRAGRCDTRRNTAPSGGSSRLLKREFAVAVFISSAG